MAESIKARTEILRDPLGRILLKKGLISAEQLESAISKQKETRQKLGRILMEAGHIDGLQLVSALFTQGRLEFIKVGECLVDPRVIDDVPKAIAKKHEALPLLRIGDTLFAGVVKGSEGGLAKMGTTLNCRVEPVVMAGEVDIQKALDQAYSTQQVRHTRDKKIGQHLVDEGMLTADELKQSLEIQAKTGQRLGEAIVSLGFMSRERFYEALSGHLGLPFVRLDNIRDAIVPDVARVIPRAFAEHNLIMPFGVEKERLRLLVTGPIDRGIRDYVLAWAKARSCEQYLATPDDVRGAIREAYDLRQLKAAEVMEEEVEVLNDPHAEQSPHSDAEIPKLINQMLVTAIQRRASDIHIEQQEGAVVTRLRIDGMLQPSREIPIDKHNVRRAITKIKLDCKLDIAERRKPQDGSFTRRFGSREHAVDFRVAVQPTLHGENVIIRILDRTRSLPALEDIGFQPDILRRYRRMIENPQGMILFTGPTGSGKTTSLYATLDVLRRDPIKIITAEDPVEYSFPGIQQCQVNDVIGNTFARFMKGFLRQDPDVILVGEIRDPETAEFGVRAALTGHLVFSTLHTNDTVGTVRRLLSMKVDPDLVAGSLLCVVSQRLVRTICRKCRQDHTPAREVFSDFYPKGLPAGVSFKFGRGCEACDFTGYRGRMPIFEFWEIDEKAEDMIQRVADDSEMRRGAVESGMVTMVADGLEKAERGITTLSELRESIPYLQIQTHRKFAVARENARAAAAAT